jgi:hypothetical protein
VTLAWRAPCRRSRHRQAAFLADHQIVAARDDLGVDQHARLVARVGGVDHDHALVHVDLGRRQAHAFGGVHGLEHVVDEAADALVDAATGLATVCRRGSG